MLSSCAQGNGYNSLAKNIYTRKLSALVCQRSGSHTKAAAVRFNATLGVPSKRQFACVFYLKQYRRLTFEYGLLTKLLKEETQYLFTLRLVECAFRNKTLKRTFLRKNRTINLECVDKC